MPRRDAREPDWSCPSATLTLISSVSSFAWTQSRMVSAMVSGPAPRLLLNAMIERFAFLLNELSSQFTCFELDEFTDLRSIYARECYRRLKQFRKTGVWKVGLEDFRRLIDVPKSYATCDVNKKVLKPIEDEPASDPSDGRAEVREARSGAVPLNKDRALREDPAFYRLTSARSCIACHDRRRSSAACPRRAVRSLVSVDHDDLLA